MRDRLRIFDESKGHEPLVCVLAPVMWSVGVAIGYAMFPSTDTAAVIAEAIWIIGVLLIAWWLS